MHTRALRRQEVVPISSFLSCLSLRIKISKNHVVLDILVMMQSSYHLSVVPFRTTFFLADSLPSAAGPDKGNLSTD